MLGARVDTLRLAYAADLNRGALVDLDLAQYQACNAGTPVEYRVTPGFGSGVSFALYPTPAGGKQFRLVNDDATVLVGSDRHGFTIIVDLRAIFLATRPLAESLDYARRLARWIAPYEDEVVRRIDLCADATGVAFDTLDAEAFIGRARCQVQYQALHSYATKSPHGLAFTGFTFAPGNPIQVRFYDKTEELRTQHSPDSEKVRTELGAYRAHGWNGTVPVWRLEAELSGKALKQLRIRKADAIADRLDGTWRYLFGHPDKPVSKCWLRLALEETSDRRDRRTTDERWRVYQRADFGAASKEAIVRIAGARGGASLKQSVGTVFSTLGAVGRLHTEAATAPKLLRKNFAELQRMALEDVDLMRNLPTRCKAIAARFSSSDDTVGTDAEEESA